MKKSIDTKPRHDVLKNERRSSIRAGSLTPLKNDKQSPTKFGRLEPLKIPDAKGVFKTKIFGKTPYCTVLSNF